MEEQAPVERVATDVDRVVGGTARGHPPQLGSVAHLRPTPRLATEHVGLFAVVFGLAHQNAVGAGEVPAAVFHGRPQHLQLVVVQLLEQRVDGTHRPRCPLALDIDVGAGRGPAPLLISALLASLQQSLGQRATSAPEHEHETLVVAPGRGRAFG